MSRLKRLLASPGFRLGLALAVSALTLYLALRPVDLAQVRRVFAQVDWRFAALGVLSGVLGIAVKVWRWMLLLRELPASGSPGSPGLPFAPAPPAWRPATASFLSAQLVNNFFPLRLGEIGRVAVVGRDGLGYAFVAGTIAIEKTLDLAAFGLLFAGLVVALPSAGWLGGRAYVLAGAGLLILALALLAASQQRRLAAWLPAGWNAWLLGQARLAISSLDALRRPSRLASLAVLTALIWGLAWWTNHLVSLALGLLLPPGAALLVLVALQVGVSLPSLPGRVGIFEYVCVLALQTYGIDPTTALSYGILLHVVVYAPVIAGGLPALWLLPLDRPKKPDTSGSPPLGGSGF